jgi:hypothetical protein
MTGNIVPISAPRFGAYLVVSLLAVLSSVTIQAQVLSPYSVFQTMTFEDMKTLEVKLTHVGPSRDVVSTVAFTSPFNTIHISLFAPFRRPGISYRNDELSIHTFTATQAELKAVIDNVGTLPNVTAGGVATSPYLSFSLLNTVGGTKVFEAVLNLADTSDLMAQLRLALRGNATGLRFLAETSCALGVLEPERPTDVSSRVKVSVGGVRLNRTTGRYVAPATIQNTSATGIGGPISLVLMTLGAGLELFNRDGATCGTEPVGRPFINVPVAAKGLAPGAQATVNMEFDNPDRLPVALTTKVLAGVGAR